MEISFKVDDAQSKVLIRGLEGNARDISKPMAIIAEKLRNSVMDNFDEEGRFSVAGSISGGPNRWEKSKKSEGKTLYQTGILRRSILRGSNQNSAWIRTNIEYAAVHNFGGMAGRGRKSKIQARPFMVIQQEDLEKAATMLRAHMLKGL